MSYILDAIRKAEQERQKQQSPELLRIQSTPVTTRAQKRGWLPWLVLFVLVVLVTAGLNLWFLQSKTEAPSGSAVVQNSVTPESVVPEQNTAPPKTTVPTVEVQTPPTNAVEQPTEPTTASRVPLWQAPAQAKAAIAALQFSFHVYSDNPARRTIIINRKRMREGQQISSDLLLQGIDEQGVVIAWQNVLVEVPVLEQW